jgi:hypothetical protein
MKKLLIGLATIFALNAPAFETLTSTNDLVTKTNSPDKMTVVVFVDEDTDPSWAAYKANILQYEKENSDIVFLVAPLSNLGFMTLVKGLGFTEPPVTLFSINSEVFYGGKGSPATYAIFKGVMQNLQAAAKKFKAQREIEKAMAPEVPKSHVSPPPGLPHHPPTSGPVGATN